MTGRGKALDLAMAIVPDHGSAVKIPPPKKQCRIPFFHYCDRGGSRGVAAERADYQTFKRMTKPKVMDQKKSKLRIIPVYGEKSDLVVKGLHDSPPFL